MSITSHYYGRTQNGEEIYQYILENAAGMRVAVIEYGCVITHISVSYTHLDVYKRQGEMRADPVPSADGAGGAQIH